MNSNRDIIIRIDNIVYGGYGLGRVDGKVIFVESGIPGDVVKIALKEEHKDYSTAVITGIIEPSSQRVTPICPVADLCGGCSYLNVNYDSELEFKRSIIIDQLKRVAHLKDEELPDIKTIADNRYNYRSHTRFNTENGIKGFFRRGTNTIVGFPDNVFLLLSI
jgi:23S rRNA (uracil1939-C5)-methyltransferase